MEEKFIQLLLKFNSLNQKLKCLSSELDQICNTLIDEEFEKLFIVEQIEVVKSDDFE